MIKGLVFLFVILISFASIRGARVVDNQGGFQDTSTGFPFLHVIPTTILSREEISRCTPSLTSSVFPNPPEALHNSCTNDYTTSVYFFEQTPLTYASQRLSNCSFAWYRSALPAPSVED